MVVRVAIRKSTKSGTSQPRIYSPPTAQKQSMSCCKAHTLRHALYVNKSAPYKHPGKEPAMKRTPGLSMPMLLSCSQSTKHSSGSTKLLHLQVCCSRSATRKLSIASEVLYKLQGRTWWCAR